MNQQSVLDGTLIEKKPAIEREILARQLHLILKDLSLEEFCGIFINKFEAISLLFNPHRFTTKSCTSDLSIYEALKEERFCSGLARALIFHAGGPESLYNTLQININNVQFINEFPPHVARELCIKYGVTKNSKVLDPCAGWGGRMIGVSNVCDYYDCFEPSTKTFFGLYKLQDFIQKLSPCFESIVECMPFEDAAINMDYYDFALTSPPYYDTEEYSDEETNSLNRYKTFDDWCNGFYIPMIQKTMDALKHGCSFILNIGSRKYPLSTVLKQNFSNKYHIEKAQNRLSGAAGLNKSGEGETFYQIKKI